MKDSVERSKNDSASAAGFALARFFGRCPVRGTYFVATFRVLLRSASFVRQSGQLGGLTDSLTISILISVILAVMIGARLSAPSCALRRLLYVSR